MSNRLNSAPALTSYSSCRKERLSRVHVGEREGAEILFKTWVRRRTPAVYTRHQSRYLPLPFALRRWKSVSWGTFSDACCPSLKFEIPSLAFASGVVVVLVWSKYPHSIYLNVSCRHIIVSAMNLMIFRCRSP